MDERKGKLADLVNLFEKNKTFYTSKDFNESEVRSKFIDPFLECLNWDVSNKKGARPDHQEVTTEGRLKADGKTKYPDYTLCYGRERKIYIEAKRPNIDIKQSLESALQVRRYAYSSKMPIAILTDFEEFAIYDTRIKPTPKDTASTARIEYFTFDRYVENFEALYNKISWNAVDKGDFNTYYEGVKDKKGTSTVDDDILSMIEEWRIQLAKDIALNNSEIDEFNLTGCVQKIIDRLLFLRIAEDKEIEEPSTLQNQIEKGRNDYLYENLKKLFDLAGDKYNAGLFETDEFLNALKIQDKTLSAIISALYYPECQYEFSVIPVEILGNIYERFLGKVIRFVRKTKYGHSVEVIEKPEVKKAGGVYYTPTYIVKYIVEQTIGKKIENRTPVEISKMRFVDPACGSGSFLVGAYQYLLDYHLDYYLEHNLEKEEKNGKIYKDSRTQSYKLSVEEKRRILLNNIYGVDIDAQAVEVTKLSLFLKLLENEGRALSDEGQADLFRRSEIQQKILPSMAENIRCGNSLIGSDYYDDKDLLGLGLQEQRKVNVFDWKKAFPTIFEDGGFDCVIGNPPYVRVQNIEHTIIDELKKRFKTALKRIDISLCFIEKSKNILKHDGITSFITSNQFLTTQYGRKMRRFLLNDYYLIKCVDFGDLPIFSKALTYVSIFCFTNKKTSTFNYYDIKTISDAKSISSQNPVKITISELDENNWNLKNLDKNNIFNKLKINSKLIKEIGGAWCGIISGKDEVFLFTKERKYNSNIESELFIPLLRPENCEKYFCSNAEKYILYPYKFENNNTTLYTEKELKYKFPNFYEYLLKNKEILESRKDSRSTFKNRPDWYSLTRFSRKDIFEKIKIVTPGEVKNHKFCIDFSKSSYSCARVFAICIDNPEFYIEYVLCILNSSLIKLYLQSFASLKSGGYYSYSVNILNMALIKNISLEEQKPFISLAEQMLEANKELKTVASSKDREMIEQKIRLLDRQINARVYKLYNLTDDEIRIVEGS